MIKVKSVHIYNQEHSFKYATLIRRREKNFCIKQQQQQKFAATTHFSWILLEQLSAKASSALLRRVEL